MLKFLFHSLKLIVYVNIIKFRIFILLMIIILLIELKEGPKLDVDALMLKTSFSEYSGTASGNKYSLPLTAILPTLKSGVCRRQLFETSGSF